MEVEKKRKEKRNTGKGNNEGERRSKIYRRV